jgi:hypothetical protein
VSRQSRRTPPVEHRGRVTVRAIPQAPGAPSATAAMRAKAEQARRRGIRDLLGRANTLAETGRGEADA